ncbi:hypothetical protein ALNOE001_06670 [Candidatus Methanobinarius endosymbioticus]|uniref:Uncharacterized protein n=1 Tax=Candidatus Methanobinarius endosymbioticus TaxID=2006182 RepID=A0A366MC18_9EURY|nr:hypothetical protein ALNOE001_06670 [Candidatus Methanobinarius endosymbioticus]
MKVSKANIANDNINLTGRIYYGTNNTNINVSSNRNITIQSHDPNNKAIVDCNGNKFISNSGNLT